MEIEEFMFFNGLKDVVIYIDVYNLIILRLIGKFMLLVWVSVEKLRVVVKVEELEFDRFLLKEEYVEFLVGLLVEYVLWLREGDNLMDESQVGFFQRLKKVFFIFLN